jgi:hypothetical protein
MAVGVASQDNAPAPPSPSTQSSQIKKSTGKDPKKRVVLDGGTGEADQQILPELKPAEAERLQQVTAKLLSESEADLQKLASKQLTPDQQATAGQIRSFLSQSKDASEGKDWQRAYHLAFKAQLLADDLVRQ